MYLNREVPIKANRLNIDKFKEHFNEASTISVKDIYSFYRIEEEDVKETTVNWRIYSLVEKGVIQRVGRGEYKLGEQKEFQPEITLFIGSLFSDLQEEYPYLDMSIWSTDWIKQWMLHIPKGSKTIVEVERGSEESVFYFISDSYQNVFLNPSLDILEKYADDSKGTIIVKNLITGSPLQKLDKAQVPSIEKIIVDLIIDDELFSDYQGRDLDQILKQANKHNTINRDRLYRYANRRGKGDYVEKRINRTL